MKRVFKVILIAILCTIGGMALLVGGAYVFGAMNEKIVYAEDLYFNQTEVISAESFSLRIETSTEDVTRKTVKLEAMQGGERIINFPETVTIGEDFFISPMTNSNNQNIGGVVELYCKYEEKEADQSVIAKCKILIDVNVESCSIKLSKKQYEIGSNILVAEKGVKLSEVLDVTPSNALNPYILKSLLDTSSSQGVFSTFSDKKIFLTLPSTAKFVVDNEEQTNILELPYTYNDSDKEFYITSKIEINPIEKGEIVLKSYICPTYKNQDSVTTDNLVEKTGQEQVLSSNLNLIVNNYKVESMTTNASTSIDINYGEEATVYLNNPNAEQGSLNLGVQLFSTNTSLPIDDYYLKFNVFVEVVGTGNIKSLKDSLYRLNGSTSEDGKLNVYYDGIDDQKSTWCFKYKYSDFMAYYNYKNSKTNDNRIELKVWYENTEDNIKTTPVSFYFIPKAREIASVTTKYDSGEQFVYRSGSPLSLTKSNFNITYANSSSATFDNLGYFIKIEDGIVFYPTKSGDYKTKFSFTPTSEGKINAFSGLSSWGVLGESVVTFTQGNNSCKITFNKDGSSYQTDGSDLSFVANEKINVEINSLKVTTPTTNFDDNLFFVTIGETQYPIKLKQVKFYDLTDNKQNTTPILIANGVTIAGEYSFVTLNNVDYIYLKTTDETTLSGIGSFDFVAMNIYQEDENSDVYYLGISSDVAFYVYEEISSLRIYNYDTDKKSYSGLSILTKEYEENSGQQGLLFITSTQLDTLSRLVEIGKSEGKSRINFVVKQRVHDTLTLTDEQISAIAEKNKNAITFGELTPVYDEKDSTKLIGFTVSYTIGDVYTLSFNNIKLDNAFDINVQLGGADNSILAGQFVYENNEESQTLTMSVVDNVYKKVAISHTYSGLDGSSYATPIKLLANSNSSNLTWSLTNGSLLEGAFAVNYGLKRLETDKSLSSFTSCKTKTTLYTSGQIENPSFYCYYDNTQQGIVFKNVPYYEDGVIFKFQVYVEDSQKDSTNSYYEWRDDAFVATLFEDLGENVGATIYFQVVGLNISITANESVSLSGINNSEYSLFGNGGVFAISGTGSMAYNKALTLVVTSDMGKYIELSEDYSKFTMKTNFLKDEKCSFTFYVGEKSSSNILKISSMSNFTKTIASALEIVATKEFTAPNTTGEKFATITAKGGNATEGLKSSIAIEGGEDFASVNSDGNLVFKTITGERTIKVILTLYYASDESTKKIITYDDIKVTSKYFDSELVVGTEEAGEYYITAGETYSVNKGVSFTGGLGTDSGNISEISATFENATIGGNSHIVSKSGNLNQFTFSSYDLKDDKDISITFTLTFNDGGQLVVTKNVKLKANLTITFKSKSSNYQSGNSINLSDVTNYVVTRNGSSASLNAVDFSKNTGIYDKNSFKFDDTYLYDGTTLSDDSICMLYVRSANPPNLQAQDNVETTITFTYKVMVNGQLLYTLDFVLTLKVNIITTG